MALRHEISPEILRAQLKASTAQDGLNEDRTIVDLIEDKAGSLPEELELYVLRGYWEGGKSQKSSFDLVKEDGVIERYQQLWDACLTLRAIAQHPDKDKAPASGFSTPHMMRLCFWKLILKECCAT